MGKGHRLVERRQAILAALEHTDQLSVADLCGRFAVSEVTIRTDLRSLNQQGLLQRTRGGTLAIHTLPELSFGVRQQQYAHIKGLIGAVGRIWRHDRNRRQHKCAGDGSLFAPAVRVDSGHQQPQGGDGFSEHLRHPHCHAGRLTAARVNFACRYTAK